MVTLYFPSVYLFMFIGGMLKGTLNHRTLFILTHKSWANEVKSSWMVPLRSVIPSENLGIFSLIFPIDVLKHLLKP